MFCVNIEAVRARRAAVRLYKAAREIAQKLGEPFNCKK